MSRVTRDVRSNAHTGHAAPSARDEPSGMGSQEGGSSRNTNAPTVVAAAPIRYTFQTVSIWDTLLFSIPPAELHVLEEDLRNPLPYALNVLVRKVYE